jgi:hypothetical protein
MQQEGEVLLAFVRKKRVHGGEYYQFVENFRVDGVHRQRVLAHLGEYPTVEAAIEAFSRFAAKSREIADRSRVEARAVYEDVWRHHPEYLERHGGELPRPEPGDRRSVFSPHAPAHKRYWYLLDSADESELRAAQYEEKLGTLRGLMESGKAKPDPPEMKRRRKREREEGLERLRRLEASTGYSSMIDEYYDPDEHGERLAAERLALLQRLSRGT